MPVPPLNAAQPRPIPSFESMRIGGQPLPTSFALALRQSWTQLYDLRDYLLNLFVDDEVPNGPQNGSNKTFTLANAPLPPQSLALYRNGQILVQGTDYNLISKTITLAIAPISTDTLIAFYRERLSVNQPSSQAIPPAPPTGGGGGSTGGLWTQVGNNLFPTATATATVLLGTATWDGIGGLPTAGNLIAIGRIISVTAATNSSSVFIGTSAGTEVFLASSATGTGTLLPISIYTNNSRAFTIQTSGALLGGLFTSDVSPTAGMIVLTSAYFLVTAATNASTFQIHAGSGVFEFISSSTGTGAIVPVRFSMGGSEIARWTTGGTLFVGLASSDFQPNSAGGAVFSTIQIGIISAATNASAFRMVNSGGLFSIQSTTSGSGTLQAITFIMGGTEVARITTTPAILVGLTSSDATAASRVITIDRFVCVTAATNASSLLIAVTAGTEGVLATSATGTGTLLPLSFYTSNNRTHTITTNGALIGGSISSDAFVTRGDLCSFTNVGLASAATNASLFYMTIASSLCELVSSKSGTGTVLPIMFNMFGTEAARFSTSGTFIVGFPGGASDYQTSAGRVVASLDLIVSTAATNSSFIRMIIVASIARLESAITGTGSFLPLAFFVGGGEVARITTTPAVLIGLTSSDATAASRVITIDRFVCASAATNATTIFFGNNGTTEGFLAGGSTGTGTNLPLSLYVANSTRALTVQTGGTVLVGALTSDWTGGTGRLVCFSDFVVSLGTTNTSAIRLGITGAGGETFVQSTISGTGTQLPLSFFIGSSRICQVTSGGFAVTGTLTVNGTVMNVP